MKIFLMTTDNDLIMLAGDGRLSERVFSSVGDFDLSGELERQIVTKVRGSHALPVARGRIKHRAFFRTRRLFPTQAEAEAYVANAERGFPRTGTLYFITGAGTRKLREAVVTPPICTVTGCEARLQYQAAGGEFTPLEPETVIDGISGIQYRIVDHLDEKWFEVGFDSPFLLDGNAADGWLTPDGLLRIRFYRSENLTTWDNDWIACPTSPESITGGYRYWARSKYPQDSKAKSGEIRVSSGYNGLLGDIMSTDTRNNPFTGLTIAGVAQALGGFPYTMPTDAARMQADIRALGWTGATVEASSDTVWRIIIPTVNYSSYAHASRVSWPVYYVADMFGVVNQPVDGAGFAGAFFNTNGVRTAVTKQFARLGLSAGPNYLY